MATFQPYYVVPKSGTKLVWTRGGVKRSVRDVRKSGRPSNVDLGERWLRDLETNRFSTAFVTSSKYSLMRFFEYLADRGLHVSDVGRADFMDYVGRLRDDPEIRTLAALRRHLNVLVSFFRDLSEDERSGVEEVLWVRLAAIRRKQRQDYTTGVARTQRRALDEDEALRFLEGIHDARDKAMAALLWSTGIRNGELVALQGKDVVFDEAGATITLHPHAKRNPTVGDLMQAFLTKDVAEILRGYGNRRDVGLEGPLFPSYSGKPLTRTDVNRRIRLWAERAGINGDPGRPDLTTHGLRWTFTTTLVKRGCPEWAVARLRGDTRERSMVSHYTGDAGEKELRAIYLKYWPELGLTPDV
jgi:integrase